MTSTDSASSIRTPDEPTRGRGKGRRIALAGLGTLALLTGGAYAAGYAMAGDELPRHASVEGVALGGVDEATAITRLKESIGPRAEAPIALATKDKSVKITPAQAGMSVDYAATVEQAGAGKSLNPRHIINVLRGGGEMDIVVDKDSDKLQAAVAKAAPAFEVKPVDAKVTMTREKITPTEAVVGQSLDQKAAAKKLDDAWMTSSRVEAPITSTEPELTTKELTTFVDSQLKPRVNAPVEVKLDKQTVELTGPGIGELTKISTKDGGFVATTDMDKLFKAAQRKAKEAGMQEPVDARWELKDGKPALVPGKPGKGIERKAFDEVVAPALVAQGAARTVTVPVVTQQPEITTEKAKKAPVSEVIGEFTTYFPHADYRNTNLSVAARRINNSYFAPGETFSVNEAIGPRTAGSGFVDGWVITGDHLVKENAGGISQAGTTAFNALFFSGLEHVEHQPHTMYFDRYPAGREATLYYGSIDVKFKNNSPYGALMQAWVNPSSPGNKGSITVRVWGKRVYDKVTSSELSKSNFTTGRTIHRSGEKCHDQAAAPGFTVNYSRLFHKGGQVVKREPYRWTYQPTDKIICD